jgi:hypothetical protein
MGGYVSGLSGLIKERGKNESATKVNRIVEAIIN